MLCRMSVFPRVSVITPTRNREWHLQNLLSCFRSQTYNNLELLVLDDSERPSPLLQAECRHPLIRYIHSTQPLSVGEKRNRLVQASAGDVIVQFDDDDFYAPRYVETMVGRLEHHDLVKLGAWFGFSCARNLFFYWDTTCISPVHFVVGANDSVVPVAFSPEMATPEYIEKNLWGYGFSYAYRKRVLEKARFADADWGEDLAFVEAARSHGFHLSQFADAEGLALHVIHGLNTSRVFPQYLIPPAVANHLFGQNVKAFLYPPRA